MIVKSFKEPTDIVLIGNAQIKLDEKGKKDWYGDFLITDDECAITFKFGDKKFNLDTLGFFSILTMDEFNAQREYIDEDFPFNFLFLPGFKGDVEMRVEWTKKEFIKGEGRKVVDTHIVSEFPDENEYVMYVNQPETIEDEDWSCNVVLEIEPTKVVVIDPEHDLAEGMSLEGSEDNHKLIWPKMDSYVHSEWDQTLFNGSRKFQNTQMGHGFLVFEDDAQDRGKRKDVIKGITHEITRNLGKYLNAEAIKFMPYHQDEELDKLVETMESGPFEAQLK